MAAAGKIYAIGDIHGRADKLDSLLQRLPLAKGRDTLVFLGDYLDRGKEVRQVLETLCALEDKGFQAVFLLGNHEHLLLEYARTRDSSLLPYLRRLGIESTLESYGGVSLGELASLSFLPPRHQRLITNLRPFHQAGEYLFVHAGIIPGKPLSKHTPDEFCETREPFLSSGVLPGKRVIFGHTRFATPLLTRDKIGIDTGSGYGGMLTAVELPHLRFVHA